MLRRQEKKREEKEMKEQNREGEVNTVNIHDLEGL